MSTDISITLRGGVLSGRKVGMTGSGRLQGSPLIVALHGGGYSSAYFDIPGYSLLERAAASGCDAVALDRPGYGASTLLTVDEILDANAERLDAGIGDLWGYNDEKASGILLVGHSIGAAVAILIAARSPAWPLLGIAISGVGLSVPPAGPAFVPKQGSEERLNVPSDVKSARMFGPPGSYPDDAPAKAATANEPVVWREIVDINTRWQPRALDTCARVRVPVHSRQGENDGVWAQGAEHIESFRKAFSNAPSVDVATIKAAGHCIDFHNAGRAFQQDQIAFAIECARRKTTAVR